MDSVKPVSPTHIAVMTRIKDLDPALASGIRRAAFRGKFSPEQAAQVAALLRQLPMKEKKTA